MNTDALITALRVRLMADTGSGGLFATGAELVTNVYGMVAPSSAQYAYLVIDLAATSNADAFALDLIEVRFRVHCFTGANGGMSPVDAIMQRVYGSANRTPTYGLHRHALSLAGGAGWTATNCQWQGRNWDNDEDHYHAIDDYTVFMQRASA